MWEKHGMKTCNWVEKDSCLNKHADKESKLKVIYHMNGKDEKVHRIYKYKDCNIKFHREIYIYKIMNTQKHDTISECKSCNWHSVQPTTKCHILITSCNYKYTEAFKKYKHMIPHLSFATWYSALTLICSSHTIGR